MVRTLILVRHAKAKAQSDDGTDFSRSLTATGKRSCAAAMARLASVLAPQGSSRNSGSGLRKRDIALWTSPAVRAEQTARILAEALPFKVGQPQTRDCLYSSRIEEFLHEVSLEDKPVVIAVGHNPFLENTVELLTGKRVCMGKAAAVAVEFSTGPGTAADDDESDEFPFARTHPARRLPDARVAWILQGPDHRLWNALVEIDRAFDDIANRIEQRAHELAQTPDDAEALHQYRISLRVARSVALFVEPYCAYEKHRKLLRALKTLQDETSYLRELDVMHELLGENDQASAYADGDALLARLVPVRDMERRRFVGYLSSKGATCLIRDTCDMLRHISWRGAHEKAGVSSDFIRAHYDAFTAAYELELASCDFRDALATHTVRKHAKRQRYVARELAAVLGEGADKVGKQAKELQELLGDLCDARVNLEMARELLGDEVVWQASTDDGSPTFAQAQMTTADRIIAELAARRTESDR